MNLFGFNIQISRHKDTTTAPCQRLFDPQAWLAGDDVGAGGPILSNAYEQVVWVYRAVNVLAEQVANVPFVFSAGERGRENLVTSGPLLDFYNRPHPQLNRFQYWELRVIWLMLRGECFRVPIYEDASGHLSLASSAENASGHLTEHATRTPSLAPSNHPLIQQSINPSSSTRRLRHVLLLDPARFQHIIEDHRLIGWRYTGLGPRTPLASQVFLPEEVWFEKLPNPFDFWRGFPPLYVAELAAKTDFAASLFMRGIIENNADTGVMVRTDKWLSDEQRQQILDALRDRKRRAGQADRPVLLLGSAEVIKPQLSSTDLQFLENRKFSRAEICAAFGVPEEVVTSTDHAKYDVMAGARLNFIENRVAPLCSRLEAAEDVTVKTIDPEASGWFDLDSLPILQDARRQRLAAARTGFEMGIPFNELNRVLDLGFKPLPWGDEGFVGAGLQRLGRDGRDEQQAGASSKSECRMPNAETPPFPESDDSVQQSHRRNGGAKPEIRNQSRQTPIVVGTPSDLAGRAELFFERLRDSHLFPLGQQHPEDSQLSTKNPQLLQRLRRFLFEQRRRVPARLSGAAQAGGASGLMVMGPAETPLEAIFDLQKENAELAKLVPALPTDAPPGLNETILAELLNTLRTAISDPKPEDDVAEAVKAFYNHNTERLLSQTIGQVFRDTAPAASTPKPTPTAR